jgi:hypothetical protein
MFTMFVHEVSYMLRVVWYNEDNKNYWTQFFVLKPQILTTFYRHSSKIFWTHISLRKKPVPFSTKIFRLQKCIIIIIFGCKSRDSCRQLFKTIQILPLPSQYILTLLLFVVKNRNQHRTNSEVHDINTRQHYNLHQPLSSLVKYQKGVYYNGIKVLIVCLHT